MEAHSAMLLNPNAIEESDLILVMEARQRNRLMKLYPKQRHKIFLLGQFCRRGTLDIQDPFGGTEEDFKSCFERIRESCDHIMQKLAPELVSGNGRDVTGGQVSE